MAYTIHTLQRISAVLCAALSILVAFPGFSLDGERLSPDEAKELEETGTLSRYLEDGEPPSLAPTEHVARQTGEDLARIEANIGVEVLFRVPAAVDADDMLHFTNTLLAFGELEGLHYYSASRDRMRLLFEESYTTDLSEETSRLPDRTVTSLPATLDLYLFQRDLTFGDNRYRAKLHADTERIHVVLENLTSFRYGPIRLIRPDDMRLHIYLIRADSALYYYSVFGADSFKISILEKRIHRSFYHRLAALYAWFEERTALYEEE